MANNVKIAVGAPGAKQASSDMDKVRDKFAKLREEGAKGYGIGAGAAVAAKGLSLIEGAAEGVVNILGDSVKAAMEDEASVQKLGTALKANVKDWDGNTDAIERTIKARMSLGFSDDEQRDSLARLVAATHDVNKALDIQRTAMDLARFKGISLAEASDALIKVEGGQYRALKALGIVLKEGATQTEAMAAVQKVATGQAENYTQTVAGKLLVAQTEANEAMESLGRTLLPIVADGLSLVSGALDNTSVSFERFTADAKRNETVAALLKKVEEAAKEVGVSSDVLWAKWQENGGNMQKAIDDLAKGVGLRFSDISEHAGKMADDVGLNVKTIVGQFSSMDSHAGKLKDDYHAVTTTFGKDSASMATAVHDAFQKMIDDVRSAKSALSSAGSDAAAALYDPQIAALNLYTNTRELKETEASIHSGKLRGQELTDAKLKNAELLKDRIGLLTTLAESGDKNARKELLHIAQTVVASKHASADQKAYWQGVISKLGGVDDAVNDLNRDLKRLRHQAILTKDDLYIPYLAVGGSAGGGGKHRASGGPVTRGEAYIVGENHPEMFVPDTNGRIEANPTTGATGTVIHIHPTITNNGLMTPAVRAQLEREMGPLIVSSLKQAGIRL